MARCPVNGTNRGAIMIGDGGAGSLEICRPGRKWFTVVCADYKTFARNNAGGGEEDVFLFLNDDEFRGKYWSEGR